MKKSALLNSCDLIRSPILAPPTGLKNQEDEKNADAFFKSPDSKNLAGSSRVTGLKTLNTPKGAGAQTMSQYYLKGILQQRAVCIEKRN